MSATNSSGIPETPLPESPADPPPTVGHPDQVMPTLSEPPPGPPPADPFATVSPTLTRPPAPGPTAAPAARGASAPPTPQVAGFTITGELGRGGMGVVYKATHAGLKRECALKMILSGEFAGPNDCERLLQEAEVFAKLRHPNIVQIFELGRQNGLPYLALEYVEGGNLAGRLRRRPCSPRAAAGLVETLARAMQYAHERGVVHRDLKPSNVLLTADGEPKITDFGLAKSEGAGLTGSGAVLGTPSYMPPEQAAGKSRAVGPEADVYALGAILYEALAGRPPFVGETPVDVILQITRGDRPPPLHLAGARNPRDLEAVVLKCLEKEPSDRYRSAGALADDLRCWLSGRETVARPLGRASRLWRAAGRNARGIGVGVAVLALAAAVTYLALRPRPAPAPEGEAFLEEVRAEVSREVNKVRAHEPRPIKAPQPSTTVETAPARPDYSAFEFLEDRRVWDLRLWKPVPPERRHEYVSAVCSSDRKLVKKVKPADEYRAEARTTGLAAFLEVVSHPESFRVIAAREKGIVGTDEMKVRQVVLDVRDVPVGQEFEVRTEATYWNNLQDDRDRWLGIIGYDGSCKVSILFIFPPDRSIGDFELLVAQMGSKKLDPEPYTGRKALIVGPNRDYLYWDILEPKANHVYLVRWKW